MKKKVLLKTKCHHEKELVDLNLNCNITILKKMVITEGVDSFKSSFSITQNPQMSLIDTLIKKLNE